MVWNFYSSIEVIPSHLNIYVYIFLSYFEFHKYNSSSWNGDYQHYSSLNLADFHLKWRHNFSLVHKLDCFSRRLNQKVKTLAYAFLHPWVGHADKTSSKLTMFCSRKLRFFTSSFTWTSMPCFALRKAYWRYISASSEFSRPWAFQPFYRLIWTKVIWKSGIHTTLCT